MAALALPALLALPLACGGQRGYTDEPSAPVCQGIAWGGWNGSPQCAGISAIVVSGEQRICQRHEDCIIVGNNGCAAHAVNQASVQVASQHPAPCLVPLAGVCSPRQWTATCEQGCCVPR